MTSRRQLTQEEYLREVFTSHTFIDGLIRRIAPDALRCSLGEDPPSRLRFLPVIASPASLANALDLLREITQESHKPGAYLHEQWLEELYKGGVQLAQNVNLDTGDPVFTFNLLCSALGGASYALWPGDTGMLLARELRQVVATESARTPLFGLRKRTTSARTMDCLNAVNDSLKRWATGR